jgi:hypothetical protein
MKSPLSKEEQREALQVIRRRREARIPARPSPGWVERFWKRLSQ